MKVVTVIVGALLLITGIYALINMKVAVSSLAFVLGAAVLAYGISQIVSWFTTRKQKQVTVWLLAEGVITSGIGVLIIVSKFSSYALAIWFASWLIVSGVMRIMGALNAKKLLPESNSWMLMMLIGVLTTILGLYGVIHPVVAKMAIGMLIGFFFMMQGICWIIFGLHFHGKSKEE